MCLRGPRAARYSRKNSWSMWVRRSRSSAALPDLTDHTGCANADLFNAVNQHDIARLRTLDFDALQSFELVNLVDFARQYVAAWAKAQRNGLAFVQRAARDAADADASNIARIVQRGDLQLQRPVWVRSAHRDILQDGFKQRL